MKMNLELIGNSYDFEPKLKRLKPPDQEWLDTKFRGRKNKKVIMNADEAIHFIKMFNEIEEVYFEVK
jgi:hypothetical protein